MKQDYTTILQMEEFAAAGEHLGVLLSELISERMMSAEHGTVEEELRTSGAELLRRFLQGYLDKRAKDEPRLDEVEATDGPIRTQRRAGCQRTLMTIFGEVTVTRIRYGKPGTESLVPLDARLNLPNDKYSDGLRKLVAEEASLKSFDEVVLSITKLTAGEVPKQQAEQLVVAVSRDFENFYTSDRQTSPGLTSDPLILTLDGKGIVMIPDSLREATKKAAENEKHKMQTRLSKGEKRGRKRMATVAAVYDVEKFVRHPSEIMMRSSEKDEASRPHARNKRVWASVEREALAMTEEVFEEALRRDPQQKRPWAILVDGQSHQLHNISVCIEKFKLKRPEIILDFVHVLEYLWKAAFVLHAEGSEEAEEWLRERALSILSGGAANVAAGIRRSATMRKIPKADRGPLDTCADYLLKYAPMMQYYKFLDSGLPIATGIIEGACRHLIKDRMDVTGARWSVAGAEAILKVRSLRSSGDFEDYLDYHKGQELQRNHLARYATSPLRSAA